MIQDFADLAHVENLFRRIRITVPPRIHRCERSWSWRIQSMPDHDLWCVLGGQGEMVLGDGEPQAISPGSCWLLEPGSASRASHDPEHRLRVLAVHFDLLDEAGEVRRLRPEERPQAGVRVQDLALLEALGRGCVSSARLGTGVGDLQCSLYIRQLLLLLLEATSSRAAEVMDPRIAAVYEAIREEPGRDWGVEVMARRAHLSRSQFSRLFRQATGRSPARYVVEARIERASELLRETRLPVGAIADALGYRDIFYFSRQFKEVTGQSPSAWRSAKA